MMVVAGAAGTDSGTVTWSGPFMGSQQTGSLRMSRHGSCGCFLVSTAFGGVCAYAPGLGTRQL